MKPLHMTHFTAEQKDGGDDGDGDNDDGQALEECKGGDDTYKL